MAKPRLTAPGEVRVAPIIELPSVLEALGVPPRYAFEQAGVPLSLFDDAENHIEYETVARLMSVCSALTHRSDLGLLVSARFRLRQLGPLGELMRHSATVEEALKSLVQYFNVHDRLAFPLLLQMEPASVFLGYSIQRPEVEGTSQIYDLAIAITFKILRELCGPDWQPRLVELSHHQPENEISFRRIFGPRVLFNAEWSGITFAASWLEQALPQADPVRYSELNREILGALAADSNSFTEQVTGALHRLLLGGNSSAASVANLFAISERTLRHRLRAEGTRLQQLLAETRFELARHLLQSTKLPVSKIAASLCYSDTATFSRAFHHWAGLSPRQWRASKANLNSAQATIVIQSAFSFCD